MSSQTNTDQDIRPATNVRLATSLLATLWAMVACGGGGDPSAGSQAQIGISTARASIQSHGGAPAPTPTPTPTPAPAPAPAPPASSPATAPAPAPAPVGPAPAPGGGTKIPPNPTIDGAAWFFNDVSVTTTVGFTPDIDYTRLENMTPGGIPIGSSRFATELVYNVSKKTPLTLTDIRIAGANPGDFVIDPQAIAAAEATVVPANKSTAVAIQIAFRPTAPGPRSANVVFTSAAGVVQIAVSGIGLAAQPILSGLEPLTFLPDSAFASFVIQNTGGVTLVLKSITLGGTTPAAFQFFAANSGQGNCFAGVPLAPLSYCFLGVGVAAGASAPAKADLIIVSNDPAHPTTDVPLSLAP